MSIFNFKIKAKKRYELGELIGRGGRGDFYRIKNERILGVKIHNNRTIKNITVNQEIEEFKKEIQIANLLIRKKIPVPKYIGITNIYDSNENKIKKGLILEIISDETHIYVYFNEQKLDFNSKHFKSHEILLEINFNGFYFTDDDSNFESDLVTVYRDSVCNTLNLIIQNMEISKDKLVRKLKNIDLQGLYSSKTDTFYLIDFESWDDFP